MDFVYIVKKDEHNDDLRYSLRSIAKFYPKNRVWIVGYKPSWIQNVNYIPVKQTQDKWKNSILNIQTACECENISEDFILMNDDFFCIDPLMSLEDLCNSNLDNLEVAIKHYRKRLSRWNKAFKQVYDLLEELNIEKPYYNFEAHLPLQINRKKYLEVMSLPKVQEFMKTKDVLHKRTLYKNYDKPKETITLSSDIKLHQLKDDSLGRVKICGWISVYDGQVNNHNFSKLNKLLHTNFPNKCKYEVGFNENKINPIIKNIQNNQEVIISEKNNIHKDRFLHY